MLQDLISVELWVKLLEALNSKCVVEATHRVVTLVIRHTCLLASIVLSILQVNLLHHVVVRL